MSFNAENVIILPSLDVFSISSSSSEIDFFFVFVTRFFAKGEVTWLFAEPDFLLIS